MERISGPYKGHFIAAYTVQTGHSFVGYAKICHDAPHSVWSAAPVEKLAAVHGCRSELEAMTAAENKARQAIVHMQACETQTSDFSALQ
jgi:hypothetical protein